jgi:signal peptidase I
MIPLLVIGTAIVYGALRWRPFRVEVRGDSMIPTLEPGDWALAVMKPVRFGDIVVVEHPERPGFELVKRVIAMPGDVVADGRTLGPDELWIQGDAGESSSDSRSFGPVRRVDVRGTVVFVWWPSARLGRV